MNTELTSICGCYEKHHDELDQLFSDYRKYKNIDFNRAKGFFNAFMLKAQQHMKWEEDIIYPIFERKTGIEDGPISIMKEEHHRIYEMIRLIDLKIQKTELASDRLENDLMMIIGLHSVNEENILYPVLDRLLSQDEKS